MKVGVFCGNAFPVHPAYQEDAKKLGMLLALGGFSIFCGGSNEGLMGHMIRSALDTGGKVFAIVTEHEISLSRTDNPPFTDLSVVSSIAARKKRIFEEAEAFIALPGGVGTLSEMADLLVERQIKIHSKPFVLLNTGGYWDRFITLIVHMKDEGFIKEEDTDIFHLSYAPQEAITFLKRGDTLHTF